MRIKLISCITYIIYIYMYISYIIQARYEWCQANGVQFVPPVSHDQQSQGQRLPPGILVKG